MGDFEPATPGVPDGYRRTGIPGVEFYGEPQEAWTNGKQTVVLGTPPDDDTDGPLLHDCDALGCLQWHVLAWLDTCPVCAGWGWDGHEAGPDGEPAEGIPCTACGGSGDAFSGTCGSGVGPAPPPPA